MNNKAVSTIVVTVILVALVLVAVGVVWAVISNLIGTGSETTELAGKCLNVEVRATAVTCAGDPLACSVTFERTGVGNDAIDGVKIKFKNDAGTSSDVIDEDTIENLGGDIEKLVGKTVSDIAPGIAATINTIEVTPYFLDKSGAPYLCTTTTFNF